VNTHRTNAMLPMRKRWIGLAAGLFVSLAAIAWLGRDVTPTPAASAEREAPVREKRGTTADPVPRAEDKKALLRLFLLVGLARKQ